MPFKVLVTPRSFRQRPGEHKRILQEAGCQIVESNNERPLQAAEMVELIGDMDGVITGLDEISAEVIAAAPKLRVISKYGTGLDNIDLDAATQAGIIVTYTPGANHISVAELTLGLMLALARHIPQHDKGVKAGSWKRTRGIELAGKKLGIVGLGRIGLAVARRAHAFEMHILYYDVRRREDAEAEGWVSYVDFNTLLAEADFVSLHCPFIPEQGTIIGETQLRMMKPSAYLINTARGRLVDEAALARALREGWIAGAASDAFVHEPPTGSPLLTLDNFVASPHAGAATHEAMQRMAIMAARNTVLALQGQRPLAVVNPAVYEKGNSQGPV